MARKTKLINRTEAVATMLQDGNALKEFYAFMSINPHISLHDGCQIVVNRKGANVCFSFDEWNAMGRRITRGSRGIVYYDNQGYKHHAFDIKDTHGQTHYKTDSIPLEKMLIGLDELNGTSFEPEEYSAEEKVKAGVIEYLRANNYYDYSKQENMLLTQGVTYSLYSKSNGTKQDKFDISGLPFSLQDNADIVKQVHKLTKELEEELLLAYERKRAEVSVIDDTEEETISDEPTLTPLQPQEKDIQSFDGASTSNYKDRVALVRTIVDDSGREKSEVYLGLSTNYNMRDYDNSDNSLVYISSNKNMFHFLFGNGYCPSQEEMVNKGMLSEDDYQEFDRLQNGVLKEFECINELKFGIDVDVLGSGKPFTYPNYQDKPKYTPYYTKYLSTQAEHPRAVIAMRLGDFYEVMGEYAQKVSDELDLTLTTRTVAENEKVLMCGFPYHVADSYIDKIRQKFDVLVVEADYSEKFLPCVNFAQKEQVEESENEPSQEEYDEFEQDYEDYINGNLEFVEDEPQESQPQEIKPKGKGLRDRKRKSGGQQSLFEFLGEQKSEKQQVIDFTLKRGSSFSGGKGRIYEQYLTNPTAKDFASFLRDEYGTGGSATTGYSDQHNAKGISAEFKKDNGESIVIKLNWVEVANGVADLIDDNEYFSDKEWQEYLESKQDSDVQENDSKQEELKQEHIPQQLLDENTKLDSLEIDSDLGGAKQRFRNNILAIKLVKRLEFENRSATAEEKTILAKYVGFGGLAQAFDEFNESWQKEYTELKGLLSIKEYEDAKGSVLNAHYTSKEVIKGMYNALTRFGVGENNKILEPSMGTGNFFGYMPSAIANSGKLFGVELDSLTGRLAQKLYPQANIQIKGFEETSFSDNSFDVVVGNVPFGGYGVHDTDYNKHNFLIHDYFLAKSIDKLKPNGIMAVITSKGTLDKQNPQIRKYLADRAELVGAVRLPNTAFKKLAGTEVVADILFFKKREQKINADTSNTSWLTTTKTEQGFEINSYFVNNPQMVLGTLVEEHGLYGAIDVTVKSDGRELTEAITEAVETLPQNFYTNPEISEVESEELEADYDVKPLCYKASGGKIYMRMGDSMVEQTMPKFPKDAYERVQSMIEIRLGLCNILDLQTSGCSDVTLKAEQYKLNNIYDKFTKKYGLLNSQTNTKLFKEDGDSALVFACENLSEDKRAATKADIFSKRTIRPYVTPTQTDDCFEALQISKNERGKVDLRYIEELTKKDFSTVKKELATSVFRNPLEVSDDPYSGYESAEGYLSGDVKRKLQVALNALQRYGNEYAVNVSALEAVQPTPLSATEIAVRIGSSWVETSYYKQFLCDFLGVGNYYRDGVEIFYNHHDNSYKINKTDYVKHTTSMKANSVFGTQRANAFRLFEDALNLRDTKIYDTVVEDGKEKRVLNNAETIQAREKQEKIKEMFKDWIYSEPERRENLEQKYNAVFNKTRLPEYDGSYLKFPEMNPSIKLKPHQKNAVHRIITGGNTLLHHVVGSGKTYTICASIMKLRQYGLAKKPMVAVPNHLVGQWANEFRQLYPNAKLLIANKEDLEKSNREKFVSRVAMGDWDAVIIAQSSFAKINISPDRQIKKIRHEIGLIEESIASQWEDNNFPRGAVKTLERIKKGREATLKKLLDESKKDNVLIFEKLGVDYLFVDEAHYYKNKFLYTKMNNVAGISSSASQRASDLEMKVEYINELHGKDMGVVFATGTPISNSMTEMYTMQSYLQKRELESSGIHYFDSWAGDFGETVTSLEMTPSGQGYKAKTRFAKFTNLPELLTMYRSFADVQTADMVKLDVPEAERNVVQLKPSETVIDLAEEIADRAENISRGGVNPHVDNMLKVTSDGKKLALDPRCFDPLSKDEDNSKINSAVDNIYDIWESTTDSKGTQIVFCDLSTPKRDFAEYEQGKHFDAYNEIKYKLVQKGVSEDEIAYIHEAKTDLQKQNMFNAVNSGKIRVLIGSTEKCGAGTNVQKRLVALHHLDTPYRPSDLAQREGRIIRQGNTNNKVQIFTYVTERTFDSYSYQILENKQRFISQIDKGNLTIREADDIDETTLSYAEIKAITAANPKIKRKMELDSEATRLRVLEGQYKKNLYSLQDKIRKVFPQKIQKQTLFLERLRTDIDTVKASYDSSVFSINVNGIAYTDKKEGARALTDALYGSKPDTVVAEYGGLKISLDQVVMFTDERTVTLSGEGRYSMAIGNSASGNIQRLDNFLEGFASKEQRALNALRQLESDLEIAEEQVKVPFENKSKLEDVVKELSELNAELDLNKREEVIIEEENNENESQEVHSMEVPKAQKEVKPRPRKPLNNNTLKAIKQEQDKKQTAYVFVKNGDNYELVGEKSIDVAFEFGLNTKLDTVLGEKVQVLTVASDKFETIVKGLAGSNREVKIIEELNIKEEDELLDNVDVVADMQVEHMPDPYVKQAFMHEFGYHWDGMLPLRRSTAKRLSDLGLEVYMLYDDSTESLVEDNDFEKEGLYGIEKPDWVDFISSEKGNEYFRARLLVAESASKLINEELSFVQGMYADPISNTIFEEKEELQEILEGRDEVDQENLKPYFNNLVDEYANKFTFIPLEGYGLDLDNIKSSISSGIKLEIDTDKEFEKLIEESTEDELKKMLGIDLSVSNFEKVQGSISQEFNEFKADIVKMTPEQIFDANYKIRFYDEINSIFEDTSEEAFEDETLLALQTDKGHILSSLYDYYINSEYASIGNYDDTRELILGYCDKYKSSELESYRQFNNNKEQTMQTDNKQTSKKEYINITIARDAVINRFEKHSFMRMPQGKYEGWTYNIFNSRLSDSTIITDLKSDSRELAYNINLAKDDVVLIKDSEGSEKELTATELYNEVNNKTDDEYKSASRDWLYVNVDKGALVAEYENRSILKMPKGNYAGYCFYLPNGFIKQNEGEDSVRIALPREFMISLVDNKNDRKQELSANDFIAEVSEKTRDDYYSMTDQTIITDNNKFKDREKLLRKNVPLDMQARDNWVIVRTKKNEESGRLAKFLISPITGKFAESDNPETWSNFETACEYARKNGGETLAYALDGKDKVACIDVDHCKVDGQYVSNIPSEIRNMIDTYSETSISGEGEHFFGKTNGMDLRAFSKDGDLEFYQKSHFIAMTGDSVKTKELASFDNPKMKEYLSSKCEKRTMVKGSCQGVSGLSIMSDRDLVDKASSGKHGDTFKSLYDGKDLQNNHSNSDMSLMNRLAFWCNGDKEQMLRIFATSGLFRDNKSPDYYEGTALKAIKDTTLRYNPNTNFSNKPLPPKTNSGGNSKV